MLNNHDPKKKTLVKVPKDDKNKKFGVNKEKGGLTLRDSVYVQDKSTERLKKLIDSGYKKTSSKNFTKGDDIFKENDKALEVIKDREKKGVKTNITDSKNNRSAIVIPSKSARYQNTEKKNFNEKAYSQIETDKGLINPKGKDVGLINTDITDSEFIKGIHPTNEMQLSNSKNNDGAKSFDYSFGDKFLKRKEAFKKGEIDEYGATIDKKTDIVKKPAKKVIVVVKKANTRINNNNQKPKPKPKPITKEMVKQSGGNRLVK